MLKYCGCGLLSLSWREGIIAYEHHTSRPSNIKPCQPPHNVKSRGRFTSNELRLSYTNSGSLKPIQCWIQFNTSSTSGLQGFCVEWMRGSTLVHENYLSSLMLWTSLERFRNTSKTFNMPLTKVICVRNRTGGKQYIVHLYPQKYGTFNVGR